VGFLGQRSAGRLGGLAAAARHDSRRMTQAARRARWQRYLDRVDPDRALPEGERVRRAEALRRADMLRMSAVSVVARSRQISSD